MPPEVILAGHSGFCFGVKRAISIAGKELEAGARPVYSFGPIIHNPAEVERLSRKGLRVVGNLDGIGPGTLIIRSHGAHPDVFEKARACGLKIADATCPFVKRLHDIVNMLREEGYRVVAAGEREHPEVMALPGVEVAETAEDALKVKKSKKIGLVSQTTRGIGSFREIVSALTGRAGELRVFNTICSATEKRQSSALELASRVEVMAVVGGHNSANTRRLAEICRRSGTRVEHIENANQIDPEVFRGAKKIGVAAGASTPRWVIEEVAEKLGGLP